MSIDRGNINSKKICTMCKKELNIKYFYKDQRGKYGVRSKCKICFSEFSNRINRELPLLFLTRSYCGMQSRVKRKNHRGARYYFGLYVLPKKKFIEFSLADKSFKRLHKKYVKSNLVTALCPSVDRIDPSKGYSLNNIRGLTTKENCYLGSIRRQYHG